MSDKVYDNNFRGVLFKNEDKQDEKHADYSGSCRVDEVDYFMNAWLNKSKKSGKTFMSFSFKRKDKQSDGMSERVSTGGGQAAYDPDAPF